MYRKHQENAEVIGNTKKVRSSPLKVGETPTNQAKTPRKSGEPKKDDYDEVMEFEIVEE